VQYIYKLRMSSETTIFYLLLKSNTRSCNRKSKKHEKFISLFIAMGLASGVALLDNTAEACVNPVQSGEGCGCHYSAWGYNWCMTDGYTCAPIQTGCGGGPGQLPF